MSAPAGKTRGPPEYAPRAFRHFRMNRGKKWRRSANTSANQTNNSPSKQAKSDLPALREYAHPSHGPQRFLQANSANSDFWVSPLQGIYKVKKRMPWLARDLHGRPPQRIIAPTFDCSLRTGQRALRENENQEIPEPPPWRTRRPWQRCHWAAVEVWRLRPPPFAPGPCRKAGVRSLWAQGGHSDFGIKQQESRRKSSRNGGPVER